MVGVPALVDNLSLVYNKKLFAAGRRGPADQRLDVARLPRRRQEADRRRAPSTYGWAYVNDGSEDTVWRYLAMLWQAGGDLLTADNTKAAFDSPAGKAALQQLQDMAVTDKSVYLDTGQRQLPQPLQQRQDRACSGPGRGTCRASTPTCTYGVTYLPGYNGNHETISGPDLYMLFDHSASRSQSAFDFVTWLTSRRAAPQVRDRHR